MYTQNDEKKTMIVILDLHCDASLPLGAFDAGGGNKYSRNLISVLISKHIPILYFTINRGKNLEEKLQIADNSYFFRITVESFDFQNTNYTSEFKQKIIDYVKSVLKDFKEFMFVFHSIYWISGEIAEHLSYIYNSYFVHTIISNGMSKRVQGAGDDLIDNRCQIEKRIYDAARYIICSSTAEAEDINKYYNISPEKIVVSGRWIEKEYIYPYYNFMGKPRTYQFSTDFPVHYIEMDNKNLDESFFENWQPLKGYIYVGRIHVNKGITQIITAWKNLYQRFGEQTPPLWLVGGTPYEILDFKNEYLKDDPLIAIAENHYKLVWWGTLSAEGISTLMLKSLVLIMHSKYEAGGNVLLEAMAHAIPVIATPFGYARDYIRHSENGYLVKYDDVINLTKYMEYFMKQPYLSNYMGRIAENDIKELTTGNKFIEMHFNVYNLSYRHKTKKINKKVIPRDSIDTFFQTLVLPDNEYIYYLITQNTNFQVLDIYCKGNINTYYLWEIVTNTGTIYFYYLYTILNRKCIQEKCDNYFISKVQRITFLQKECLHSNNRIYYIDCSAGYIILDKKVNIYL